MKKRVENSGSQVRSGLIYTLSHEEIHSWRSNSKYELVEVSRGIPPGKDELKKVYLRILSVNLDSKGTR